MTKKPKFKRGQVKRYKQFQVVAIHEEGEGRMIASHEDLWRACKVLPSDYEPYGKAVRVGADCSCGCKYYHALEEERGADWGVCFNLKSHRTGLLTFEHQGCSEFVEEGD